MLKRLVNPNTVPYGDVLELPIVLATKAVFDDQDNYLGEEEDPNHCIEFIGGFFQKISIGKCRLCGSTVSEYSAKYYQRHYESGQRYSFLFCSSNYYCEACAKKAASEEHLSGYIPPVVERYITCENGVDKLVEVFADGSIMEG